MIDRNRRHSFIDLKCFRRLAEASGVKDLLSKVCVPKFTIARDADKGSGLNSPLRFRNEPPTDYWEHLFSEIAKREGMKASFTGDRLVVRLGIQDVGYLQGKNPAELSFEMIEDENILSIVGFQGDEEIPLVTLFPKSDGFFNLGRGQQWIGKTRHGDARIRVRITQLGRIIDGDRSVSVEVKYKKGLLIPAWANIFIQSDMRVRSLQTVAAAILFAICYGSYHFLVNRPQELIPPVSIANSDVERNHPSIVIDESKGSQRPAHQGGAKQPRIPRIVAPIKGSANEGTLVVRELPPAQIRARIIEAERLLTSRLLPTVLNDSATNMVTLALLDRSTAQLHLLSVSKEVFLTKSSEVTITTSLDAPVTLRVLRANGVNTAVRAIDSQGQEWVPLVVEFPIEKRGSFIEMAYYSAAHPALLSPELTKSGQAYVHSMIDRAAKRLREKGAIIAPNIVDVAEQLCLVEHIDHDRFRNENRQTLFDEIYSLYALNQMDTYRYSVSAAGSGGMVQMIPNAYDLERQRHPDIALIPDFVIGMRDHQNALQAMLLYMQDMWNDLAASEDVQSALVAKIATPTELLVAGYNSTAAKLPLYLRRGGNDWRTLIPRETQIYLQIYEAVERVIPKNLRSSAITTSEEPSSLLPEAWGEALGQAHSRTGRPHSLRQDPANANYQ